MFPVVAELFHADDRLTVTCLMMEEAFRVFVCLFLYLFLYLFLLFLFFANAPKTDRDQMHFLNLLISKLSYCK
jgi:hypothetical protein